MNDIISGLPYDIVEEKVFRAACLVFGECRARVQEEHFYGFAVCPDCDVRSFFWMAASEETLRRKAEQWLNKTAAEHNYSLEAALGLFRFQVPDWGYHETWLREQGEACLDALRAYLDATNSLGEIWDAFEAIPMDEDTMFDLADSVRRQCLDAIVRGLQRFDARMDWSPTIDRNRFALLVYIPDPDDPEEIRDMARRLNPPDAFNEFSEQYHLVRGSE